MKNIIIHTKEGGKKSLLYFHNDSNIKQDSLLSALSVELRYGICSFLDLFTQQLNLPSLTQRTKNILINLKIRHVYDFLMLEYNSLMRIPNCGKKSCNEIVKLQVAVMKFIENQSSIEISDLIFAANKEYMHRKECQKILIKYKNLNLQLVNFSNRLHNILVNNNINSIDTLLSYTEQELQRLPNMGKTSLEELKKFLYEKNIKLGVDYEWDYADNVQNHDNQLCSNQLESMNTFLSELKKFGESLTEEKAQTVYLQRLSAVNISTLQDIGEYFNISRERIRQIENKLLKQFTRIFLSQKEIYDSYFAKYGQIVSFDEGGPLDDYKNLKWLLVNLFAHNIDEDYSVDYERKLILININIYDIYNKITWNKVEFTKNEIENNIKTIIENYVNNDYYMHFNIIKNRILTEILDKYFIYLDNNNYILNHQYDESIQQDCYKKHKYFSALTINRCSQQINNRKINKHEAKSTILSKFISNYCQNEKKIDDIHKEYHNYLACHNPRWVNEYSISINTLYNRLQSDDNFLLSKGKSFRYINYTEEDIAAILANLNLEQYEKIEISTLVIFRENIELMKLYDMRNEYELHNFIKKFYKSSSFDASRMPMLQFGNIDRKEQVISILYNISIASSKEIAKAYEERYGVKEHVFMANYLPLISEYNNNGQYSCNVAKFDETEIISIKKILSDDFYPLKTVQQLLSSYYGKNMDSYLNNYNMNKLGYNLLSSCIYSNKYSSITSFVNSIIQNNNIFKLSNYPGLFNVGAGYNVLQEKKQSFDVIEFQPNKFINIKLLNSRNITKEDIINFINMVEECVKSEFFTITSIYNGDFSFPKIDACGFEDIFYINILYVSKRFNIKKINGKFLIRHISEDISINEFIIQIMQILRIKNIYDLIDYIYIKYGIKMDKHFIISACNISEELYYSDILEKVYINYDEYLRDL